MKRGVLFGLCVVSCRLCVVPVSKLLHTKDRCGVWVKYVVFGVLGDWATSIFGHFF